MRRLAVREDVLPIRGTFAISRGSRTEARVVVVEIAEGGAVGRGECVPQTRYGESIDSVIAASTALAPEVERGLDRETLQTAMPPGAARNAMDCALWDLEAKRSGRPVWQLAELPRPHPVVTAYTLSLDTVDNMARAALAAADRPLLKLKLSGDGDMERVAAVRQNAPRSRLIVDANEAWHPDQLERLAAGLVAYDVTMIEQPLPAGQDQPLTLFHSPIPLCADESCHDSNSLDGLVGKYAMVNIKLDKTGGLTEALHLANRAQDMGFAAMVGCMLGSSLAMAPAVLVAQNADIVDLDGPLLLAEDRAQALHYDAAGRVHPSDPSLWG